MVARGEIPSGSTTSSTTAGRPAPSARSTAASTSSVRVDDLAVRAERGRVGREVRIHEIGPHDAAREVPLLVHPDRARTSGC